MLVENCWREGRLWKSAGVGGGLTGKDGREVSHIGGAPVVKYDTFNFLE